MKVYFAPMEGITGYIYRNAHAKYFGGVDKYFTPFLSPNKVHKLSTREKKDIIPEHNQGLYVVPQILTNQSEHFLWAANRLKEYGYEEINLNLGCPSGTVVSKKKGAGFLGELDALDRFLDDIFTGFDGKISIKTRLGLVEEEEFHDLLEIYDSYPLEELIIHPRVREDFYKGRPRKESYAQAKEESKHTLCYNGNIFHVQEIEALKGLEEDRIMVGRGAIANPALPDMIKGGKSLDRHTLLAFHDEILDGYLEWNNGERNSLFKMKELWFYFGNLYPDEKKLLKKIKKSQNSKDYQSYVKELILNREPQLEFEIS